jgi:probable phosphoglycerate mutase
VTEPDPPKIPVQYSDDPGLVRELNLAARIVLVRHAQTEWSVSGQHTGRTDIPLTDLGRRRAVAMGPVLAQWSFDAVLCSPLSRARETCELSGLGASAQFTDDLLEWDYGDYEGITTKQIRASRGDLWDLWRDGCPGGEQAEDVGARVDRVIARCREIDGNVAVFAHGHVLRVLGARWLDLPPASGALLALSTGSISMLGYEHETAVLWQWNDAVGARAVPE